MLQAMAGFPNQTFINAFSVAIWNRDKIVMVIAASLWLTDVATSIRGKSSIPFHRTPGMLFKSNISPGIVLVNK